MICECGCGGIIQPGRRFVRGHNQRGVKHNKFGASHRRWRGDAVAYNAAHVRHRKQRTNVCERCGADGTQLALIHGRGDRSDIKLQLLFSVRREDYIELCRSCHLRYDDQSGDTYRKAGKKSVHVRLDHSGLINECRICYPNLKGELCES